MSNVDNLIIIQQEIQKTFKPENTFYQYTYIKKAYDCLQKRLVLIL